MAPPQPTRTVPQAQSALRELAARWQHSELKERQAFQTWFREFCDALGVEAPGPEGAGSYSFEWAAKVDTALAGRGVVTVEGLMSAFKGSDRNLVARHLDPLEMLGEVGWIRHGFPSRSSMTDRPLSDHPKQVGRRRWFSATPTRMPPSPPSSEDPAVTPGSALN